MEAQEQPATPTDTHHQHDLRNTPGKFTDDAAQGTSGEGAITARPEPDEGDQDMPAAIAKPSDAPNHEKGPRSDT